MAFWGVEVKPGRPFTLKTDIRRLHLSQATLGAGCAIKKSVVQCNVGSKSPIYLCTLFPDNSECCQLNLEFDEAADVVFSVVGPRSVYLSGFYLSSSSFNGDDHSESFGEDIGDDDTDQSAEGEDDYEYSDSFIDDGEIRVASRSPSVSMDEDERKPKTKRHLKKKHKLSESDNDFVLNSNADDSKSDCEEVDERPISSKSKHKVKSKVSEAKENQMNGKEKSLDKKSSTCVDDFFSGIALQLGKTQKSSKGDDLSLLQAQNKIPAIKGEEPGLPLPSSGLVTDMTERPKKKRKHMKHESAQEVDNNLQSHVNSVRGTTDDCSKAENGLCFSVENEENQKNKKKKKKKTEVQLEENVQALKAAVPATIRDNNELHLDNNGNASSHVMALSTGLVKDDIFMGSPSGKVATLGRKVSVHYIGTIKESGRLFSRNSYKFRLGGQGVSDVWNVGLDGMRVGSRRRLVVPPSMSLGIEGEATENVPPNSWLELDVELLKVR